MAEGRPRFAADAMLGSLARWLRLLGYDTTYDRAATDEHLLQLAKSQHRVLLTRDRAVARRGPSAFYVSSHDLDGQLEEVFGGLGIEFPTELPVERCSMCNAPLTLSSVEEAQGAGVPARVLQSHREFWRCPACARVYWRGTHVNSMEVRLAALRARTQTDPIGQEPVNPRAPRKR